MSECIVSGAWNAESEIMWCVKNNARQLLVPSEFGTSIRTWRRETFHETIMSTQAWLIEGKVRTLKCLGSLFYCKQEIVKIGLNNLLTKSSSLSKSITWDVPHSNGMTLTYTAAVACSDRTIFGI